MKKVSAISSETPVDTGSSGASGEEKPKKAKKSIQWADQNGGLLREVQIIEVAKIKRSTAHYSSTRELSKRERLAEKETHLSKVSSNVQRSVHTVAQIHP